MISVCIASAIPLIREGLLRTLTDERGILVSAVAGESESVLRSCRAGIPKVIVLDSALPGDDTVALLRRLQQKGCGASVVLFGDWTPQSSTAARRLGSSALLSSYDDTEVFVRAIHFVAAGETYISDHVQAMIAEFESSAEHAGSRIERLLTTTERQILHSLADNQTSKDIAKIMFISYRTVQKHRANIARKLKLEGNNALLAFAVRHFAGRK
jgi:DNA-binding NarL/FixJ family response regulator